MYAVFVFLTVYAYTELMDRNPYAIVWESLKNIFALGIIYRYGDWFGASQYLSWINYILIAYFVTATVVTAWFVYQNYKEDSPPSPSLVDTEGVPEVGGS